MSKKKSSKKSSSPGKKILAVFAALAVAGGAIHFMSDSSPKVFVDTTSGEWAHYQPSSAKYQAQFPVSPKESVTEIKVANKKLQYHELTAEQKKNVYMVTYLDFPGLWKIIGANSLLKKTFTKMIETQENIEAVVHSSLTKHKGHPALAFCYKQDGKTLTGKFVVVGNTLYRISVSSPHSQAKKVDSSYFLDSLTIR